MVLHIELPFLEKCLRIAGESAAANPPLTHEAVRDYEVGAAVLGAGHVCEEVLTDWLRAVLILGNNERDQSKAAAVKPDHPF